LAGDRRESDLAANNWARNPGAPNRAAEPGKPLFRAEEARVPIVEEQVEIGKRNVETGRVRVHTVVDEEQLNLTELLERDIVEIERVPVGREVDQAPLPFEEGDVLVIPVIEERVVVQKRLVVVEEVRIRRRQEQTKTEIPVSRRVMHAEIERSAPPAKQPGPPTGAVDPIRADAAALRTAPPSRDSGPFAGPGPQTPRPPQARGAAAPQTGPNWSILAPVFIAILILLLVVASRS
jgi:uncharacterized protein (TIGR02271 family)